MITAEDPTSLQGLRVVIAGGTTGIGRATAVRLVREGARVLIFGRSEAHLNDAIADVTAQIAGGGEVHGIVGDNAEYADVARAFATADTKLGGIDAFVGVAGVAVGGVAETEPEAMEYAVRANVTGYLYDAHEALKRMKPQGRGQMVFIGSLSAVGLEAGGDIYTATKAANQAFVASFRKGVNKDGIRVSLVEPGLIGTDLQNDATPPEKQREMIADDLMLKAEDVAAAVLYILSQPSRSHVTDLRIRPTKQEG